MPKAVKASRPDSPVVVATGVSVPRLSLASGAEASVRSPALELQEALETMLAATDHRPQPQPGAALALALGGAAVIGVCGAFWLTVARLVMSAL